MEQKKSRKEKAADTKRKIFETAAGLIRQKGYAQVTVSEICRAAGIAKGSFYVYYQSKEDIVRESYYGDMQTYLDKRYAEFLEGNPQKTAAERITRFLELELAFAEYAGHELTCMAYALNLGACAPGTSRHFARRQFSETLYHEIEAGMENAACGFSCDEAFQYLESVVRGILTTWCFSGGAFDIGGLGGKFIRQAVSGIFGQGEAREEGPYCQNT